MIDRVLGIAAACAVVLVAGLFLGWNMAMTSLATTCRPQAGEILVSVHQQPTGLTCVFAPASVVGYRVKRARKAT